ncbi:MAG: hypothetical protein B7Z43_08840 [Sphingomonas sp. 12-62-6]|nr:MAG: hypothetical protein B7Z43_08840 [Sphingomonas sp. 12-62-6]
MMLNILHLHSSFDLGGKEARAVRLMNAFGDRAKHVIVSGVDGALSARDAIAKGIRYEIAQNPPPLTGKPAPIVGIRTLASEAIRRLGKSVEPSSFDTAYNSGRSTQVPTGRTLTVNARIRRRIGYDGNYVVLQPA